MIATFCNHFVRYHIFMLKCDFKQPSQYIGREHMLRPYMQRVWIIVIITCVRKWSFLTRWGRDMMTTICISFPNTFSQNNYKKSLQFVQSMQFVQLIINQNWFRQWLGTAKTLSHYLSQWWSRPMVHIWASWIDWFLHRIRKIYPCGEKRYCLSTRGIPSPP